MSLSPGSPFPRPPKRTKFRSNQSLRAARRDVATQSSLLMRLMKWPRVEQKKGLLFIDIKTGIFYWARDLSAGTILYDPVGYDEGVALVDMLVAEDILVLRASIGGASLGFDINPVVPARIVKDDAPVLPSIEICRIYFAHAADVFEASLSRTKPRAPDRPE